MSDRPSGPAVHARDAEGRSVDGPVLLAEDDAETREAIALVLISAVVGPSRPTPYVGVDAIIAKPFQAEALVQTIAACVAGHDHKAVSGT